MINIKSVIHYTSRTLYFFVAKAIACISLLLVNYSIKEVWDAVNGETKHIIDTLLDAIGIIVISLALFDVTKYLIEKKVVIEHLIVKTKEDVRHTLIKFLSIISIAISLEALVFIFRAGKTDITLLIYPITLLLVSVAVVISLDVFMRISKEATP